MKKVLATKLSLDIEKTSMHTIALTPPSQAVICFETNSQLVQFSPEMIDMEWDEECRPLDGLIGDAIEDSMFFALKITDNTFKFLSTDSMNKLVATNKNSLLAPIGSNPWTKKPLNENNTYLVQTNQNQESLDFHPIKSSIMSMASQSSRKVDVANSSDIALMNVLEAGLLDSPVNDIFARMERQLERQERRHRQCLRITSTVSVCVSFGAIGYNALGPYGFFVGLLGLGVLCMGKNPRTRQQ